MRAGAADEVCFDARCVTINARAAPGARVATLLHECGHVEVFRARAKGARVATATLRQWVASFRASASRQSRETRLAVLAEEIEAWEAGARLATRLGVRVPAATTRHVRTRALMSYARWTARHVRGR